MSLEPRESDLPRIPGALRFYEICSNITGVLLLAVVVEMVAKYGFGSIIEVGGPKGFVAFVPEDAVSAFDLSQALLIVHGWFYVVYLFACFRIWSLMRWPFVRFLLLASGGVVPALSFFLEVRFARRVHSYLAERTQQEVSA